MLHEYPQVIMTINSIQAEMEETGLNYEIIIVENSERDPYTEKFLEAYRVPLQKEKIRYTFEPVQCGPKARMKGVNIAKGKYGLFMDAHTVMGRDSATILIDTLEKHDAGLVHGALVKTHKVPPHVRGLHYRLFGNRGPDLNSHFHGSYSKAGRNKAYPCVNANLAYVLFKVNELKELRGYHPECKYYPHPEGYLPLKYLMFGRKVVAEPNAYHFHSIYRMQQFEKNYLSKIGCNQQKTWRIEIQGDPYGMVGQDHLICNAMICAYTLGSEKWLDILYDTWTKKIRSKYVLNGIKSYARQLAKTERLWVINHAEKTLDQVLTEARKHKIDGMENWFSKIGDDPLT